MGRRHLSQIAYPAASRGMAWCADHSAMASITRQRTPCKWQSPNKPMKRLLTALLVVAASVLQCACNELDVTGFEVITEDSQGNFHTEVTVDATGALSHCDPTLSAGCHYRDASSGIDILASTVHIFGLLGAIGVVVDPLVIEVPAGATLFSGTYDNGAGTSGNLSISLPTSVLPVDLNTNLVAESGTQLVVVDFPGFANIPDGQYHYTLKFNVPLGAPNVLKAMYAGRVDVGGRTYYLPLMPCVTDFAGVPGITIPMAATPQPLLPASLVSRFQGTGCISKTYIFGPAGPGPGSNNTPVLVPALDPQNLALLILLMACVGVAAAGRSRRWRR